MHNITFVAAFVNVSDPGKDSNGDKSALPLRSGSRGQRSNSRTPKRAVCTCDLHELSHPPGPSFAKELGVAEDS